MFVNAMIFLGLCLARAASPGQAYRHGVAGAVSSGRGQRAGRVQRETDGCVVPEYSDHGSFGVEDQPVAVPGHIYNMHVSLTVVCNPGYGIVGGNTTYCVRNNRWQWSQPIPQCSRLCKLTPHPSVKYRCKVTGPNHLRGTRSCHDFEPSGTVVVPECNRLYISSGILLDMYCIDGFWNHITICQPDCGRPTPRGTQLITNGVSVERGEFPWHAAIYDKVHRLYKQICGGSLISTSVVVSAAHCFWSDALGKRPANEYAVALGKIHRPWNDALDSDVHKSDVIGIDIPDYFLGERGRFQDDIALVILSTPVVYADHIRPVCIDFDELFDLDQLQKGNSGKVAGWGLTSEAGAETRVLQTTELQYVEVPQCIRNLPPEFQQYVTHDKICAGDMNGKAVCKGDSGGGLVFPAVDKGIRRYYLRGVVSTAPRSQSGHACNVNAYTTFTRIWKHATFIKDNGLAVGSTSNKATTPQFVLPSPSPEAACPAVAAELTANPTGSKAWDKCLEYQEQLIYPCEENTIPGKGIHRSDRCKHNNTLIVGLQAAQRNEFPYLVLLYRGQPSDASRSPRCAGTLISDTFILINVYCFDDPEEYYATVGVLNPGEDIADSQAYRLKKIYKHPQYDSAAQYNNIALVETVDKIRLGPSAVPACLDVFGGDHSAAVATDWSYPEQTLKKLTATKTTDAVCRRQYPAGGNKLPRGFDKATQVCYRLDEAICQKSGVPLTVENHRVNCMYSLVGIPVDLSCYGTGVPRLHTAVASYVPWIEGIVWP